MNHRRRYESRGNEEDTEEMRTPKKDLKQGYFIDEKRLKTLDVKMNSLFSQNSESANERKKCNQYMHTISHITELYEIQRIYRGLFPGDQVKINIKIPKLVFMLKNQLKNKGRMEHRFILNICRELDIELEYVIVEKTPNTIFIGDTNKCLMFEQDSIYIGEWIKVSKHKKCRHGVGMEWVPSKHLFYGEFQYNIKKGLGIIKQQLSIFIGIWDNDLQGSKGYIIKEDGRVEESRGRVIKTETQIHKLQTLLGG